MVFKLRRRDWRRPRGFENDVKEYGFQTVAPVIVPVAVFENDVKEYGFQTLIPCFALYGRFENDVKEYGFQTLRLHLKSIS